VYRLYIALGILALIAGLSASTYIYYLKYENVGQKYEQVVEVNKANQKAVREMQLDKQVEQALTRKELEAAQQRAASLSQQIKDLQNAPDAQKPAGPFFDELGKRLQSPHS